MTDEAPEEDEALVSVTARMSPELAGRLKAAAAERLVGQNFLMIKALEDFLDRLIPVSEFRLTREPEGD